MSKCKDCKWFNTGRIENRCFSCTEQSAMRREDLFEPKTSQECEHEFGEGIPGTMRVCRNCGKVEGIELNIPVPKTPPRPEIPKKITDTYFKNVDYEEVIEISKIIDCLTYLYKEIEELKGGKNSEKETTL